MSEVAAGADVDNAATRRRRRPAKEPRRRTQVGAGLVVIDSGGFVVHANPQAGELLGRTPGALIGSELDLDIPPDGTRILDLRDDREATRAVEVRAVMMDVGGEPYRVLTVLEAPDVEADRSTAEGDAQPRTGGRATTELRQGITAIRLAGAILRERHGALSVTEHLWLADVIERQSRNLERIADQLSDVP